jgi:hypothetical protein
MPAGVDLCGVVDGLLDGRDDHRTGHELIALANQNNLVHITQYIRTKLTDDQARIVYIHLRRHPESVAEFVNAIPSPEQLQSFRTGSRWAGAGSAGTIGMAIGGPIGELVGALIGGFTANTGAAIVRGSRSGPLGRSAARAPHLGRVVARFRQRYLSHAVR